VAVSAEVGEVLGDSFSIAAVELGLYDLVFLPLLGLLPSVFVLSPHGSILVELLGGDLVFSEGFDFLVDEFGLDEEGLELLVVDVHVYTLKRFK
jgi:hypothetical protein